MNAPLPGREPAAAYAAFPPPSAGRARENRGADHETVALLAAGLRPDRPDADRLVLPDEAFRDLLRVAERNAVDALLAAALSSPPAAERMSATVREDLRRVVLRRHREWLELQKALTSALELLERARVPVIVLKGGALALSVYPDPPLRPMNDIDLLVPPDAVETAVAALRSGGFLVPDEETASFWKRAYFHLPLRAPGDGYVLVELHWGIAQADRHHPVTDELFRASLPLPEAAGSARRLGPEDMLVHLSLHHAYHYFEPRLIWIYDLALLHADPPPAALAHARARSWRAAIPFLLSLAQVERVYPGLLRPDYRELPERSARVRWLLRTFGSGRPMPLFRGWASRGTQLLLGTLMLDSPRQVLRAVGSWLSRSRRFGDRAGRRPEMSTPRKSKGPSVLA